MHKRNPHENYYTLLVTITGRQTTENMQSYRKFSSFTPPFSS